MNGEAKEYTPYVLWVCTVCHRRCESPVDRMTKLCPTNNPACTWMSRFSMTGDEEDIRRVTPSARERIST